MTTQVMSPLGAVPVDDERVEFRVWAPAAARVDVRVRGVDHPLEACGDGIHATIVDATDGDDYLFVLDGASPLPDPCSRLQPEGIKGPSRIVDTMRFEISPGPELPLEQLVLGPGSEAIGAFGPYFTDRHHTFWGDAIDYLQRGVREWAIQNALMWTRDYRIDGLRLDAVHAIYDDESPVHVLRELRERVDGFVTSEMGRDDFRPLEEWGHDAMWLDNLHHELHVLLTGERDGYYATFGSLEGVVRELTRPEPERLIVAAQNHDQVGNRATGDRLPADAHRVALAIVLFSLSTPLLLMGEEHDERAPFQFFTDHIDPLIAEATREGRKREFAAFESFACEEVPDPQAVSTFERSRISQPAPDPFYAELVLLRRELPRELEVAANGRVLTLRRGHATLVADFDARTLELGT